MNSSILVAFNDFDRIILLSNFNLILWTNNIDNVIAVSVHFFVAIAVRELPFITAHHGENGQEIYKMKHSFPTIKIHEVGTFLFSTMLRYKLYVNV